MVNQKVHIVPACGKLGAGVAILAKQLGCQVHCYDHSPQDPMLNQLKKNGLDVSSDFPNPSDIVDDVVVLGNSMKRSDPWISACMSKGVRFISMPQWLHDFVLCDRKSIVVSGTHGKTTVTSMVAHLLKCFGQDPGYLVGGQCQSLPASARLGSGDYFVIEADEYDTVFFDKRAKLFWYWPHLALVNNLELDHIDIYPTLESLHQTFRYWLRQVPPNGAILIPSALSDINLVESDTDVNCFDDGVFIEKHDPLYRSFTIHGDQKYCISWSLTGECYAKNAVAAIAALVALGFEGQQAAQYLSQFESVDRRMTQIHRDEKCALYDDFAHHPTSIKGLLEMSFEQKPVVIIYPDNVYMKSIEGLSQVASMAKEMNANVFWLHNKSSKFSIAEAKAFMGQCFCVTIEDLLESIQAIKNSHKTYITASATYMPELHQSLIQSITSKSNLEQI